jgi:hypothetical protein
MVASETIGYRATSFTLIKYCPSVIHGFYSSLLCHIKYFFCFISVAPLVGGIVDSIAERDLIQPILLRL